MTGSCRHTMGASWPMAEREPSEGTWAMDWTVKGMQERLPAAWAASQRLWWEAGRAVPPPRAGMAQHVFSHWAYAAVAVVALGLALWTKVHPLLILAGGAAAGAVVGSLHL